MGNINFEITGYIDSVLGSMIAKGYAKTKTEALRLTVYEFDKNNHVQEDELFEAAAGKILKNIKFGKEKTKKFSLKELDYMILEKTGEFERDIKHVDKPVRRILKKLIHNIHHHSYINVNHQ